MSAKGVEPGNVAARASALRDVCVEAGRRRRFGRRRFACGGCCRALYVFFYCGESFECVVDQFDFFRTFFFYVFFVFIGVPFLRQLDLLSGPKK